MQKQTYTMHAGGLKRSIISTFLFLMLTAATLSSHAQLLTHNAKTAAQQSTEQAYDTNTQNITLNVRNENLSAVLEKIEKQTGFMFVYSNDDIDVAQKVSLSVKNKSLNDVSKLLLSPLGIHFMVLKDKIVLQSQKEKSPLEVGNSMNSTNISNPLAIAGNEANTTVKGKVTDETGAGVAEASVVLKGTSMGTTTNTNGEFSLSIPAERLNGTLVFSHIGFPNKEVAINGMLVINVVMTSQTNELGDVVVVGYGTQRKTSLSGAVDQIRQTDIENKPSVNLVQALQGVSPNLIIQQPDPSPGAQFNINIRGIGTMGDNSPLVVIDGITGGDLSLLNPADIENISILKDAGAAAIYGSRSANGVILITTKKGRKNTKPTISYNGIVGVQQPKILISPVPAWQNAIYKNESLVNAGQQPIFSPANIQALAAQGDKQWFLRSIFQNALQQNHALSISGGGQNTIYLFSAGLVDQQSNFVGPDYGYKRYNTRLSLTTEYSILKLTGTVSYTGDALKTHSFVNGFLMADAERTPTNYSLKDSLGRYLTNNILTQFNPLGILEAGGYNLTNNNDFFGNVNAELSIAKHFKLKGVFGTDIRNAHQFIRQKQIGFYPTGTYGTDRITADIYSQLNFYNTQLLAEYSQAFAQKHNVYVLVGAANESTQATASNITTRYTDSALGTFTTGSVLDPGSNNTIQNNQVTSLNSVFGRVSYSYSNKYFLEGNFRYDGSSKFLQGKRWGFFPSASARWNLTDEDFMEGIKDKVGVIGIRASYGVLGNQNVGNYQYLNTFTTSPNTYGFNGTPIAGTNIAFANRNLTWERAATFNVGTDVSLMKRSLTLSFDYFNKLTSDILIPLLTPGTFGASLPDYNAGKVRNEGWDFSVRWVKQGRQFTHTLSANLGDNHNRVVYIQNGPLIGYGDGEIQTIVQEGQPFNSYYGLKIGGILQTPGQVNKTPQLTGVIPQAGDYWYIDKNKDGKVDNNDYSILGNPFPRYTFGLNYSVSFKGFDLGIFLQGVGKRTLYVRGELVVPYQGNYSYNIFQHQLNFWTPTNPNSKYPILVAPGSPSYVNDWQQPSNVYLFNGAYVRLKNVQFGYTLPQNIAGKIGMQKLRIYFTGQNLWTLSRTKFIDPESTEFSNSLSISRPDNGSGRVYPTPIFIGGGIDITF